MNWQYRSLLWNELCQLVISCSSQHSATPHACQLRNFTSSYYIIVTGCCFPPSAQRLCFIRYNRIFETAVHSCRRFRNRLVNIWAKLAVDVCHCLFKEKTLTATYLHLQYNIQLNWNHLIKVTRSTLHLGIQHKTEQNKPTLALAIWTFIPSSCKTRNADSASCSDVKSTNPKPEVSKDERFTIQYLCGN